MTDSEIQARARIHRNVAKVAREYAENPIGAEFGINERYLQYAEKEEAQAAFLEAELDRRQQLPWWKRMWL